MIRGSSPGRTAPKNRPDECFAFALNCERNAAKRRLAAHGERVRELRPVDLGDDLFACQPICEAMLAQGGDFLFMAKPD